MNALLQSRIIRTLLTALLLAGCASGPTVRSNVDASADFSRYKTYRYYDEIVNNNSAYESFAAQYLKTAINREMQARGFQHDENADLLINFHVKTQNKLDVTEYPSGYYGYRGGMYGWGGGVNTSVESYTEGTLNIDVVERASRKLLWEGIAIGRLTEKVRDDLQPVVDEVVKQVFEKFPKKP